MAAEYQFHSASGQRLGCAAVKITPDIGPAYSAVFILIPALVLLLVGVASWYIHSVEVNVSHFADYTSAIFSYQGPLWESTLDGGVVLNYFQFVFLSSSLDMEYPGFLQPVVSKLAWSSLLFWRGPYDGGYTYPGVDQGMYVSNATFGMDHMVRMLGFPRIMDVIFDTFLNLAIMMVAVFLIFGAAYAISSSKIRQTTSSATIKKIAVFSVSACLSLFSMPLLAYMSNDLMLIGYLPNYRVSLIGLTMLILVYLHYLVTRPFLHDKASQATTNQLSNKNKRQPIVRHLLESLIHYLPSFIPLLQAITIGALQEHGISQLIILCSSEAVFLVHTAWSHSASFRFSRSQTAWISVFRLLSVSLLIIMVCPASEAAKQWVGYVILCLHGLIIVPGFLCATIWRLYNSKVKGQGADESFSLHSNCGNLDSELVSSHLNILNFPAAKTCRAFTLTTLAMIPPEATDDMEKFVILNVRTETYIHPKYQHSAPQPPRTACNPCAT